MASIDCMVHEPRNPIPSSEVFVEFGWARNYVFLIIGWHTRIQAHSQTVACLSSDYAYAF